MRWVTDPIVRAALRQSVMPHRLLFLFPALVTELSPWPIGPNVWIRWSVWALCWAAPQAAAYLLELEHDGRLDQMRLSGRAPVAIAMSALIAISIPYLLLGGVFLGVAAFLGTLTPGVALRLAAGSGFTAAVAAIVAGTPAVSRQIDLRIIMASLGMISLSAGALTHDLINAGTRTTWVAAAVAIEIVVTLLFALRIPNRIAHSPTAFATRESFVHRIKSPRLMRWPGLYRGMSQAAAGFALTLVFGGAAIVVFFLPSNGATLETRLTVAYASVYAVLAIGFVAVALIAREDATTKRLDLLRLSSRSPAMVAFETMLGLWIPFVFSAAAIAAGLLVFGATRGQHPQFWALPLLLWVLAAGLPAVEGWQGQWPMTLNLPIILAAFLFLVQRNFGAIAVLSITGWMVLAGALRNPSKGALSDRARTVILAALCAAALLTAEWAEWPLTTSSLAIAIVGLSPFLLDVRMPGTRRPWMQPMTIAAVVMGLATYRFGVGRALLVTVVPLAYWFVSDLIRQIAWLQMRPTLQFALKLGLVTAVVMAAEAAPAFRQ